MSHAGELRLRSLGALARATSRSAPLIDLLEAAVEEGLVGVGAASISVSRLEPGAGFVRTLVNVGSLGPEEQRRPEHEVYELTEFANLRGIIEHAEAWSISVDDPAADECEVALLRRLGKGSAVAVPIVVDGQQWGELYATRDLGSPEIGADGIDFLHAITAILAGAVQRSAREETLNQLAYHDSLTGLPNRRALDNQAAQAFSVPAGLARQVTAIAVDVNGLKQVNDTQGHAVGDRLISAVGDSLQQCFSRLAGSFVARVGGDEFVVLTVGHPVALVRKVADEVCGLTWSFGSARDVSCGAATVTLTSESTQTPHDLFAAADAAQYVAKRGRIRHTVLAADTEAASASQGEGGAQRQGIRAG
ncbi:sensor domain-containing diguanylate cyclase [soil metagenome]